MALKIFDMISREKSHFETLQTGAVSMYVRGKTLGPFSHVGHARCYICWDLVYRYFQFSGYDVTYVRLNSDANDAIIEAAQTCGVAPLELAQDSMTAFCDDMDSLGIAQPRMELRISQSMTLIVEWIKSLVDAGYAYDVDGDVLYDMSTLQNRTPSGNGSADRYEAAARMADNSLQRHPADFILWKSGTTGELTWPSPWGDGRPEPHAAWSAVALASLGPHVDLHCGGRDFILPHYDSELDSSERALGCRSVGHWLQNGVVNIDDAKMSHSSDNAETVRTVLTRYTPLVLRYYLMATTHYRNPIQFSDSMMDEAAARMAYYYETLRKTERFVDLFHDDYQGPIPCVDLIDGFQNAFDAAMNDDFSVLKAMELIGELFKALNELVGVRKPNKRSAAAAAAFRLKEQLNRIDQVLNLFSRNTVEYLREHRARAVFRRGLSADVIEGQISARIAARTARDWEQADRIRGQLEALGVILMDHEGGTDWSVSEGRDVVLGESD